MPSEIFKQFRRFFGNLLGYLQHFGSLQKSSISLDPLCAFFGL